MWTSLPQMVVVIRMTASPGRVRRGLVIGTNRLAFAPRFLKQREGKMKVV
jgi:hypothetical protein